MKCIYRHFNRFASIMFLPILCSYHYHVLTSIMFLPVLCSYQYNAPVMFTYLLMNQFIATIILCNALLT